ncbi:MAG: DUF885 domain-containing protein [candidate division Zixibacteria bacterium]|nr:DUF885 domain-containing protein [candidate division Zixibacteria bacterium]
MRLLWSVCIALFFLFNAGALAQSKAEKNLNKLADEILDNLQEYWPVNATYLGVHKYDKSFTDYSSKAVSKQKKKLRNFLVQLHKYNRSNLSEDTRINHKLLVSNCEEAVLRLWGIRHQDSNPNLYIHEAIDGIYLILIRDYIPLADRLDNIIGRMNALPKYLSQGQKNLKEIPPVWLDYSRDNISNVIDFYTTVTAELSTQFTARASEIRAAGQKASAALRSFETFLNEQTPGKSGSFSIGREHFEHLLKSAHLLNYGADSLLRIGEKAVTKTLAEYTELKNSLEDEPELPFFTPESITKSDILEYYSWEIDEVRKFIIEKELLTIPDDIGDCIPIETPVFLQGVISGIAYQPAGPFDNAKTGYFYTSPISDSMTSEEKESYYNQIRSRTFRGSVVHEAYPGHHLQLQIASQLSSDIRKWQMSNMFIEGWALYCEQHMYEQGLYSDNPDQYLKILRGVLFRAARIVVDVKLQTGQFTYEQAVDYMMKTLDIPDMYRDYIKKEVRRYTMDPTQPMSYLIGKMAIMEIKHEMMTKEGASFSLRSFHDRLLSEGAIPPSLIRRKMLR